MFGIQKEQRTEPSTHWSLSHLSIWSEGSDLAGVFYSLFICVVKMIDTFN